MIKKVVLVNFVFVLFMGCAGPIITNPSPYSYDDVVDVIYFFNYKWSEKYDQDVSIHTTSINVVFTPIDDWKNKKVKGTACNSYRTDIYYPTEFFIPLYKTALFHELIHVAFFGLYGDGDPTHTEPPGPWKMEHYFLIKEMKNHYKMKYSL